MTAMGPFDTESEVLALPEVQAILNIPPGPGRLDATATRNLRMLLDACAEAGVTLGAFERLKLAGLTLDEPQKCKVLAAIITRAHEAGKQSTGQEGSPAERPGS